MYRFYSTRISTHRTMTIGASLSAANSFFELFDRTPTIDSASSTGHKLVSEPESEMCSIKQTIFSRWTLVVTSNLIKLVLLIHVDRHRSFSTNFDCPSSLVSSHLALFRFLRMVPFRSACSPCG